MRFMNFKRTKWKTIISCIMGIILSVISSFYSGNTCTFIFGPGESCTPISDTTIGDSNPLTLFLNLLTFVVAWAAVFGVWSLFQRKN